jgi:hypothetical protein
MRVDLVSIIPTHQKPVDAELHSLFKLNAQR